MTQRPPPEDLSSDPSASNGALSELLARPPEQRVREYKYRCAQSLVFGLPVIFLQYFGHALGGPEAARWVAILQALLAGWVMYVGAAGMLFEGLLRRDRQTAGDLAASAIALAAYVASLVSVLAIFATGRPWHRPLLFHVSVLVTAVWTGLQWWRLRRVTRAA
jgi:cation transport ATPase